MINDSKGVRQKIVSLKIVSDKESKTIKIFLYNVSVHNRMVSTGFPLFWEPEFHESNYIGSIIKQNDEISKTVCPAN